MAATNLKLKFDAALPFQRAAIDAALGLFEGQPLADSGLAISFNTGPLQLSELGGTGNNLVLGDAEILTNLRRVQEQNGIPKVATLGSRDFAVEMETGTGKTYVYLRSAFELHQTYGFTKFVIVVPSVPIREGVLHSISIMRDHFAALYGTPFDHFVYDSKQLGRLRAFATANTLQLMVINIQAFQRDVKDADADTSGAGSANVIYREQDRLSGQRPIDFLRATRPVVIVDEPQKMEGTASTAAIARLNPLCTLRYSATYDSPNKIYRLGPIEALDQKLVKRIEVASVVEESNLNDAYVRLLKTDARTMTAQVEINVGSGAAATRKRVPVKSGHDLFAVSWERQEYRDGFIVEEITFGAGDERIVFSSGREVKLGQATGGLGDEVMRAQVYETVREHLDKEKKLRPRGVKVLSLFFIDRVANYRVYNDGGSWSLGKIGQWFEDAFRELTAKPLYRGLIADPVDKVHNGYFSEDRKGAYRDTSGVTKDDDATYELIMREKERLLSFDEPLRFIFSHSALREGWDNPNVFQICTLNETRSVIRKRQEIGRGLRLPVNQTGERVHDEQVNRLTVVANESYKSFAKSLQTEYEEETGIRFGIVPREAFAAIQVQCDGATAPLGQDASRLIWSHLQAKGYVDATGKVQDAYDPSRLGFTLDVPAEYEELRPAIVDAVNQYLFANRVVNARRRQEVRFRKEVLLDPEFEALWNKVSQRTRYRIAFDTAELIKRAAGRIQMTNKIEPLKISVQTAGIEMSRAGVTPGAVRRETSSAVDRDFQLPDILAYLQNETELTRRTLADILIASGRAEEMRVNPQAFTTMAVQAINAALHDLMLNGIEYERLPGQQWEMRRLEEDAEQSLVRYLDNLYRVQHADKTPYDYVEYQSNVEKTFAKSLDDNDAVKFFVKLPGWFTVDTPIGPYNPDWAILAETDDGEKLYLVQETKSVTNNDDALRKREVQKIDCGRKHFAAIGVNYGVTASLSQTLSRLSRNHARSA
jgi:type III restriction enzyme